MAREDYLRNSESTNSPPHRAPAEAQILRALSLRPGASPTEVKQLTGRAWGSVDHALYHLCRKRKVRVVTVGGRRRFFLASQEDSAAFLLPRTTLRVLHAVRLYPLATTVDLARLTGLDKAEVSRAAAALASKRWIARVRQGRGVVHVAADLCGDS